MSKGSPRSDAEIAAYRAEYRAVGRKPRIIGFVLVVFGAVSSWLAAQAGAAGPAVQFAGHAALAVGWACMLYAIFLRTRFHRRLLAKLD